MSEEEIKIVLKQKKSIKRVTSLSPMNIADDGSLSEIFWPFLRPGSISIINVNGHTGNYFKLNKSIIIIEKIYILFKKNMHARAYILILKDTV